MSAQDFDTARISLPGDRKSNQDRVLLLTQNGTTLLCVADGLGGHPRGEVAAQLVADVSEKLFRAEPKPLRDPEQFMMRCIHKAHDAIVAFGDRQQPPISPRTTVVMALVQFGTAHWVHAGDSRLYLIRDGHVLAQTLDHSQVHYIRPTTGAEAKMRSSITRCLGGLDQPPTITAGPPTDLQPGDALLLCSDGLWGQLPQEALVQALSPDTQLGPAVAGLAQEAARQAYPRSDNVTAVALRWRGVGSEVADKVPPSQPDDHLDNAVRHLRNVLKIIKTS